MTTVFEKPMGSEVTSLKTDIANLQDGLAIVSNGNNHVAIAAGQFVYVKNHGTLADGLYKANSAISANATLTSSNVTADSAGGLNALNSNKMNAPTVVNITQNNVSAVANTWINTGISKVIPANSYYSLKAQMTYQTSVPTGVIISNQDQAEPESHRRYAYADNNPSVSVSGYTDTQITLYVQGRWATNGTNQATLKGIIVPL